MYLLAKVPAHFSMVLGPIPFISEGNRSLTVFNVLTICSGLTIEATCWAVFAAISAETPEEPAACVGGADADVAKLSAGLAARKPLVNLARTVGGGAANAEPVDPLAEKLTSMGLDPRLANCRSASEARRALNSKE